MKNIHPLSWLAIVCMFAGLIIGLVPWCFVATSSYEAYQASFWCQLSRFLGIGLIFAPAVAVVGYVVLDWCFSVGVIFRRMNRWTWRRWGYVPSIVGVAMYVMSPGPDQEPNTMPAMFGVIVVGIGLMALGWLVNHWPPRSHWSYIVGRAVVPPHQHIPYTPNMEVYEN